MISFPLILDLDMEMPECNVIDNQDASTQRIGLAAKGYDMWKSSPISTKDHGERGKIFDVNCN